MVKFIREEINDLAMEKEGWGGLFLVYLLKYVLYRMVLFWMMRNVSVLL